MRLTLQAPPRREQPGRTPRRCSMMELSRPHMHETFDHSDAIRDPAEVLAPLVDSHRELLGFLQRRVGDRALAEDILQAAFVKGIERAGQLREGEAVLAWFYRLLRNSVVDHYRRAGAGERRLDALARELESAEAPLPDAQAAICRCVEPLVDTLKPEYATALRTVELQGKAVKDFAAEAGITPNNAAVRVHRAREALRRQVSKSCGTCAEHGCVDCCCGR
jgi:RNA polymerase sigma factor (sigma-70 family)